MSGSAREEREQLSACPFSFPNPTRPGASKPLDVSVFLPQDGDLVFEEHGVQPHLRVDQRHVAKPAGKRVHAALPLGEVVRVGPTGSPRRLEERTETRGQ